MTFTVPHFNKKHINNKILDKQNIIHHFQLLEGVLRVHRDSSVVMCDHLINVMDRGLELSKIENLFFCSGTEVLQF